MIRKEWMNPKGIYLPKPMNPRPINQGFVGSLADSMKDQGFLPQYPVKVARALELTCIDAKDDTGQDLLFVCIAGMHRISAALIAKIDKILCEVYSVTDDEFIDMMMTDNFAYDPARDSKLGQVFSKTEKRKACTRLLYLPKYLKMTDTALAEQWHTAASNVARWRKDVIATFDQPDPPPNGEGGQPTFPETLRRVGITPERLQELIEIDASREREDAEGNTVPVRKPPTDASNKDKETFFEDIRKDFYKTEDDFDFGWETVKVFAAQKWKVEVSYYRMYEDLHINQLRQLHQLVIEKDAYFITACEAIEVERKANDKAREDLEKACKKTTRLFCKLVDAGNEYADTFKSKWKTFEEMVKSELDIETFDHSRWAYSDMETLEERTAAIAHHKSVHEAIEKEADWIAKFMKKEKAAAEQRRKKVSKDWTTKREAAITAIDAYPRDVSFDRVVSAAEQHLHKSHGYFTKIFDAESVSSKKNIGTLEDEIKSLDRLINAVKRDADWVSKIPAVKADDHDTVKPAETQPSSETEEFDKHVDLLIDAGNLIDAAIVKEDEAWFCFGDKQDYKIICDRAAEVFACDSDILWTLIYEEDYPEDFKIVDLVKWETILRQIHAAMEAKADWIMAEPITEDDETPPAETPDTEGTEEPEASVNVDNLLQIADPQTVDVFLQALEPKEIFQHLANRFICLDGLFDENEVMDSLLDTLGKASRGQVGTQLNLLAKCALLIEMEGKP